MGRVLLHLGGGTVGGGRGWLVGRRWGRGRGCPRVVSYWEGLVEGPGEGVEVRGVRGGGGGFVGNGQRDGATRVNGSGEAKGEEAVRFAEDASGDVGKGSSNGVSVRVRGRGLARSKEALLGTWKGGRPLFNRRGRRTRNLLGGRRLPTFAFALTA